MKHLSQFILPLTACLLATGSIDAAQQAVDSYPSQPVRMIIPFAPGGASDFAGRILQPKLSEELGQQVVVDNRTGASGNVGVEIAARANPDGYTILLGNVGTQAINPSIFPKFPVRALRDLTGITLVVDVPGALAVNSSVPAATVKEFIAYAKTRPGQLNYGSAGAGSAQRLAFEFFMHKSGINLVHVPYKGGAGAATLAILGGEVTATMLTVASFIPHLKSGKVKVLAVISPKRVSQLPDTPTMVESGFPELMLGSWQGVSVPASTPRSIVNKLYSAVIKTMSDPETVKRLTAGGAEVVTSKSPEEFAAFLRTQNEFWAKIVKQTGATAE
jgi:tripartite-type tricarboxylate transporter receptor subunit TctC